MEKEELIEKVKAHISDKEIGEKVINAIMESSVGSYTMIFSGHMDYFANEATENEAYDWSSEVYTIYGDIEKGKEDEDEYVSPEFSLKTVQVVENVNSLGRSQVTVYVPTEETLKGNAETYMQYKEEEFKKHLTKKVKANISDKEIGEKVINAIMESSVGSYTMVFNGDIDYFANEATEEEEYDWSSEVYTIYGDIEKGKEDEDEYVSPEFSLKTVQVVENVNSLGRSQVTVYIPTEETLKGNVETYKQYIEEKIKNRVMEEETHDISEVESIIGDRTTSDITKTMEVLTEKEKTKEDNQISE